MSVDDTKKKTHEKTGRREEIKIRRLKNKERLSKKTIEE
jgi:hypothetical protein